MRGILLGLVLQCPRLTLLHSPETCICLKITLAKSVQYIWTCVTLNSEFKLDELPHKIEIM